MEKLKSLMISPQILFYILWCLVMPFFVINIYYDFASLNNHYLWSITIAILVILLWVYLIYKKMMIFSIQFVQQIIPHRSLKYIFLHLFFKVPLILMLVLDSNLLSFLLVIVSLMMHSAMLFELLKCKGKIPRNQIFERSIEIFWACCMQLIVMLLSFKKVIIVWTYLPIDIKFYFSKTDKQWSTRSWRNLYYHYSNKVNLNINQLIYFFS